MAGWARTAPPTQTMTEFSPSAAAGFGVQDYSPQPSIEGVEVIPLRRFNDDGGR